MNDQGREGRVTNLKVDGGVVNSLLCMQIQADIAGIPVSIPE